MRYGFAGHEALPLPFYYSNRRRSPVLWTVDEYFGGHLCFGGIAPTRTKSHVDMDKEWFTKRAVTTRTLAADVNTLEANSYFPESENKTTRISKI